MSGIGHIVRHMYGGHEQQTNVTFRENEEHTKRVCCLVEDCPIREWPTAGLLFKGIAPSQCVNIFWFGY